MYSLGIIFVTSCSYPFWLPFFESKLIDWFGPEIADFLYLPSSFGVFLFVLAGIFIVNYFMRDNSPEQHISDVWPDFDLDNYAKLVKIRYQNLDFVLTTSQQDDGSILLKDVFVPQMVLENRPPRKKSPKPESELTVVAKPESVLTVVAKPDNKHLVLLGDPGSGKSTLARYLLLSLLDETSELSEIFAGHLPLLVELRHYIDYNDKGFLKYFHHLGITKGYNINQLDLKKRFKTSPSFIIFDGLDEIFDKRDDVTEQIIGFTVDYPKARILVTSRRIGYQGKALQDANFREYTLRDLDDKQIKHFADGWLNLVFKDKPKEAKSRSQQIETDLQNSQEISKLAGNPLLLNIMMEMIAENHDLTRKRVDFYEHAAKVLIHQWDDKKQLDKEKSLLIAYDKSLDETDKLKLLRHIAWQMQTQPKSLKANIILKEEDLENVIKSYLQEDWGKSLAEARMTSRSIINDFHNRNVILREYDQQQYGFIHRTFLEYFCAAEIVDQFEKQQTLDFKKLKTDIFLAHFRNETWHEVLRFICGMIEPKFTGELVEIIISEAEKQQDYKNQFKELVFAQTCLNEAKIKPVEIIKHLYLKFQFFAKNEFVFPYADDEDDFPDDQNDFHDDGDGFDYDWSVSVDAIEYLLEHYPQYRTETYSLLQQVIQNHPFGEVSHTAVGLLAKHYQSNSETYSLLQQLVKDNRAPESYAAIHSLTEYYKDHPDTYPLLKKIIQDDDFMYHDLKNTAVESLAKHYQDRPETYSLLQEIVPKVWNKNDSYKISFHEDKKSYCTAIKSLAEYYQDHPKTYSLLQKLVKEDMHEDLRSAAVESLAKYYQNNPKTYSLLQQVVQDDKHESVRRAAVKSLTEHYQDHPEIYSLLEQAVLDDKDSDVCLTAISFLAEHYECPAFYSLLQQVVQDYKHANIRMGVISFLAKHYQNNPDTYSLLKQVVKEDKHNNVRSTVLSSLAEHYQNRPDTYSLLKQVVKEDKHNNVRSTVLSSLAEHYQNRPETYSLLQQVVQNDKHESVRSAAIESLVKHYQDRPETYSLLQQVVQNDKHESVRSVAVSCLVQHYQDRPETYSLLQQVVQNDKHESVRSVAVSCLVQHYQDRPEIYSLLQQVVKNDKHKDVRRVAILFLAKNYKDCPEFYSLLQSVVQDEKHDNISSGAVAFLAKHYQDRPETYSLLQKVVQDNNKHEDVRSAAIESLVKHYQNYPETYSLLQQVIQDDKHEDLHFVIISYLVKQYTDRPETYSLLQQFVQNEKDQYFRKEAVLFLAKNYQNYPETYSLLQQVVQDDEHEYVRKESVSYLVEYYQDHPKTYSLLQQVIQNDEHEDVRKEAVLFLAKNYQNYPETYSLLQQVIQNDEHEDVRKEAVLFLAKNYQNYPETYSLLQQVIQNDEHEDVRRVAVKSLVEQYKDHPEVLPMLKKIIINDEEASIVRSAAVGGLAKLSYDGTWQKLLFKNLIRIFLHDNWLDSKAIIDEKRVEEAAKALELPPETIRQHYEDIAKEIPLQLSWKAD
jgi:HEAT repeat protein/energy-coupling factor transporter ATP-binding protein EcfA2